MPSVELVDGTNGCLLDSMSFMSFSNVNPWIDAMQRD